MPSYTFKNTATEEVFELFLSIAAMEQFLAENENIQHHHTEAPSLGDPIRLGLKKPDAEFRDLMKHIKKGNSQGLSKSTINTF